ncbi:hypothetical protein M8818_000015 [Zalaria obscura]|uniref:Uncharacterized protein n=1 Tax=Zalaria obscura TaxID=2024903 RepID=A0ACC3SRS5_9PEZI
MENINMNTKKPCGFWPLGECKRGDRCDREHHANLNPALVGHKAVPGYNVPNETGEACLRCMSRIYPCDKKGRGGEDDPCSECRWFGGENCRCTLLLNTSYNDQIWQTMMQRGAYTGYTLPDYKGGEEASGKKDPPTPMPTHRFKAGWQGEAKEVLLRKTDMLPPAVRQCPRAYLVPPRVSGAQQKSQNWQAAEKRKRDANDDMPPPRAASTASYGFPQLPPAPTFPQMPQPLPRPSEHSLCQRPHPTGSVPAPPNKRQRNESNPRSHNDAPMDMDSAGVEKAAPSDKVKQLILNKEAVDVDDNGYTSDEE